MSERMIKATLRRSEIGTAPRKWGWVVTGSHRWCDRDGWPGGLAVATLVRQRATTLAAVMAARARRMTGA